MGNERTKHKGPVSVSWFALRRLVVVRWSHSVGPIRLFWLGLLLVFLCFWSGHRGGGTEHSIFYGCVPWPAVLCWWESYMGRGWAAYVYPDLVFSWSSYCSGMDRRRARYFSMIVQPGALGRYMVRVGAPATSIRRFWLCIGACSWRLWVWSSEGYCSGAQDRPQFSMIVLSCLLLIVLWFWGGKISVRVFSDHVCRNSPRNLVNLDCLWEMVAQDTHLRDFVSWACCWSFRGCGTVTESELYTFALIGFSLCRLVVVE